MQLYIMQHRYWLVSSLHRRSPLVSLHQRANNVVLSRPGLDHVLGVWTRFFEHTHTHTHLAALWSASVQLRRYLISPETPSDSTPASVINKEQRRGILRGITLTFWEMRLLALLLGVKWEDWCRCHVCTLQPDKLRATRLKRNRSDKKKTNNGFRRYASLTKYNVSQSELQVLWQLKNQPWCFPLFVFGSVAECK